MVKKDFDNLLKVMRQVSTTNNAVVVSVELDFELPRGFIAKIHEVNFYPADLGALLVFGAADNDIYNMALIRDPDDITTTSIPSNNVEHDVVCELLLTQISILTTSGAGAFIGGPFAKYNFEQMGIDVITARNMRFNLVKVNSSNIEPSFVCVIFYTLEEVTDADILNLLDIL